MPTVRNLTVSTKLTADEKDWLQKKSEESGFSVSQLLRRAALAEKDESAALQIMTAEIRGIRSILFQLVTAALTRQPLNEAQIKLIVSNADSTKYNRGAESLESFAANIKGVGNAIQTPE